MSTPSPRVRPSADPGWDYGQPLVNDRNSVKCDLCGVITRAGIFRHKKHLLGGFKDVTLCTNVTKEIQDRIRKFMDEQSSKKKEKEIITPAPLPLRQIEGSKKQIVVYNDGGCGSGGGSSNTPPPRVTREVVNSVVGAGAGELGEKGEIREFLEKDVGNGDGNRESACEVIANFFYENGISFDVVRSKSFGKMIAAVGEFGAGLKPPSYEELAGGMLEKKVKGVREWIDGLKIHWKIYGCSIMCDWWNGENGLTIINFLVNCPRGTVFWKSIDATERVKTAEGVLEMLKEVIGEVGAENVVQVVTDNAPNFKCAGKWLMEQIKVVWTPCASHCVNSMCKEISEVKKVAEVVMKCRRITVFMYNDDDVLHMMRKFISGGDLTRPSVNSFTTSFLSMESILNQNCGLKAMMNSDEWTKSKYANEDDGKRVTRILKESSFWCDLQFCVRMLKPLVDVVRIMYLDEEPSMGNIYHAMDKMRKKILCLLLGEPKHSASLNRVLKIVDTHRMDQLRQPLYAAGYYLNPSIYFTIQSEHEKSLEGNADIKRGLMDSINMLYPDEVKQDKIIDQLVVYRSAEGMMGDPAAVRKRETTSPSEWWVTWGSEVPELQEFARKVLGLTCSASPYETNWSAFNSLHSKKRNKLEHQKLNDLVFVTYNTKLRTRYLDRTSLVRKYTEPIVLEDTEEACAKWLVPFGANDKHLCGEDDITLGDVEEAKGNEESGGQTTTILYKKRVLGNMSTAEVYIINVKLLENTVIGNALSHPCAISMSDRCS
ncbi:hypothetical protein C5167_001150 [Papaver somniferum]|uniref:DUF659 domain-containing protein n=1 Tax=Papaver somniferum TaxID=3469 RepID=A0A4Y7KRV9_PAPSO|nr:hypothetical protein C5167_001150 [Papaver somniferum]